MNSLFFSLLKLKFNKDCQNVAAKVRNTKEKELKCNLYFKLKVFLTNTALYEITVNRN
jgi:hypothetical protein